MIQPLCFFIYFSGWHNCICQSIIIKTSKKKIQKTYFVPIRLNAIYNETYLKYFRGCDMKGAKINALCFCSGHFLVNINLAPKYKASKNI